MIKRIRAIARAIRGKKQSTQLPPADVARLRTLIAAPEWRTYQRLLELLVEQHAEAMLRAQDNAGLHYLRGLIVGLREATLYAERIAAQETHVRSDRTVAAANRRSAALYATSAWPGTAD